MPDERIAIITCTGDRPEAFAILRKQMSRMLRPRGSVWIVVDDGEEPTSVGSGVLYFRAMPIPGEVTLARNMRTAMAMALQMDIDRWVFLEDDDWYASRYVGIVNEELPRNGVWGIAPRARYFHFPSQRRLVLTRPGFSSLCRTAVSGDAAMALRRHLHDSRDDPFIDRWIWGPHGLAGPCFPSLRVHLSAMDWLSVSMKGLPGRKGIGSMHSGKSFPSPNGWDGLQSWIGDEEAKWYIDLHERSKAHGSPTS